MKQMLSAIVSMASKCKQTVSELKKVSALKHGLMDVNRKSAGLCLISIIIVWL